MSKKAVVLLSGGLDSTTCLAIAKNEGFELYAISFDYGQKHRDELMAAKRIAQHYGVTQHLITEIRFAESRRVEPDHDNGYVSAFEGSALVDPTCPVPKEGVKPGIAATYVPGRNMIFLSFGIGWADAIGATAVYIGVNALDSSGYPDCRWPFIESMRSPAWLGTKSGTEGRLIDLRAPLVSDSKKHIVLKGHELGVPWHLTHSCYEPIRRFPEDSDVQSAALIGATIMACGKCDSCRLRLKGFEEAGLKDPISYA